MSEQINHTPEEKEPDSPATFEKRTAAWMGIVYMLMFLFIITFSMYAPGRSLAGTFPLFLVPVAVAAIVISIHRARSSAVAKANAVVISILCAVVAVVALWMGVPVLVVAFGG